MKKIMLLTLMISSIAFAKTKKSEAPPPTQPVAEAPKVSPQIKVGVKGMVCAFCAQGIEKKFKSQKEVSGVEVNLENKYVLLKFNDGQTLPKEKITEILKDAGYDAVYGE